MSVTVLLMSDVLQYARDYSAALLWNTACLYDMGVWHKIVGSRGDRPKVKCGWIGRASSLGKKPRATTYVTRTTHAPIGQDGQVARSRSQRLMQTTESACHSEENSTGVFKNCHARVCVTGMRWMRRPKRDDRRVSRMQRSIRTCGTRTGVWWVRTSSHGARCRGALNNATGGKIWTPRPPTGHLRWASWLVCDARAADKVVRAKNRKRK